MSGLWYPSEYWRLSWNELRAEVRAHKKMLKECGRPNPGWNATDDSRRHARTAIDAALAEGRRRVAVVPAARERALNLLRLHHRQPGWAAAARLPPVLP